MFTLKSEHKHLSTLAVLFMSIAAASLSGCGSDETVETSGEEVTTTDTTGTTPEIVYVASPVPDEEADTNSDGTVDESDATTSSSGYTYSYDLYFKTAALSTDYTSGDKYSSTYLDLFTTKDYTTDTTSIQCSDDAYVSKLTINYANWGGLYDSITYLKMTCTDFDGNTEELTWGKERLSDTHVEILCSGTNSYGSTYDYGKYVTGLGALADNLIKDIRFECGDEEITESSGLLSISQSTSSSRLSLSAAAEALSLSNISISPSSIATIWGTRYSVAITNRAFPAYYSGRMPDLEGDRDESLLCDDNYAVTGLELRGGSDSDEAWMTRIHPYCSKLKVTTTATKN